MLQVIVHGGNWERVKIFHKVLSLNYPCQLRQTVNRITENRDFQLIMSDLL